MPCTAATHETREKTAESHELNTKRFKASKQRTDNLRTHIFSLLASKRWGQAARDDIDEDGLWRESSYGIFEQLGGFDTFNEADIGASVCGELQTDNRLLHAQYLGGVCAPDDNLQRLLLDIPL